VKVAVVWNNDRSQVIGRFGTPAPERPSRPAAENVVGALRERGHDALLCEGDIGLLQALGRFLPAEPDGRPGGIVFNMAHGIQGEWRQAHVPAMLEMAGLPFTGAGALGHALALDKALARRLLRDAGAATPHFRVMRTGHEDTGALRWPLVAKPLQGSNGFGVHLVGERSQLAPTVRSLAARYRQDVLVEEYIDGREICVALLGNEAPDVLPFVEHDFGIRTASIITAEDLASRGQDEPSRLCPARVGAELGRNLREAAVAAFHACRCRDYACVVMRVDGAGRVIVLEVDAMASLGVNAPFALAARTAGMSFPALVERILDAAHRRAFGVALARHKQAASAPREHAAGEGVALPH
jgi:D-alanine-D-alanine ligase